MATRHRSIINALTRPLATDGCYLAPLSLLTTNQEWSHLALIFEDQTGGNPGFGGTFVVPDDYDSGTTPKIIVVWSASSTAAQNVYWQFEYRAVGAGESLDQSGVQETSAVADALPGTAWLSQLAELALTASNLAAGDQVQFRMKRQSSNILDTAAGVTAAAVAVLFQYDDGT